jgi:hypothetical protein
MESRRDEGRGIGMRWFEADVKDGKGLRKCVRLHDDPGYTLGLSHQNAGRSVLERMNKVRRSLTRRQSKPTD